MNECTLLNNVWLRGLIVGHQNGVEQTNPPFESRIAMASVSAEATIDLMIGPMEGRLEIV